MTPNLPGLFKQPYPWKSVPRVNPQRLIVGGTPTFENPEKFFRIISKFTYWMEPLEVMTCSEGHKFERGGEIVWTGPDYYATVWAEANWITRHIFHPDWEHYGDKADQIRNTQMVREVGDSGACLIFWDGKSKEGVDLFRKFEKAHGSERLKVIRF